jgi:hypothetical protein
MTKTIDIICVDGSTRPVAGLVMILPLGNRKLRAFVHGETLTDYASGRRICDLRPYMILNHNSYRKRNKRIDAMLALQDLSNKIGAQKAWSIIDSATAINGKGKAQWIIN